MSLRFHFITVPHSGTRFLNKLFFDIGFYNIQESSPFIRRRLQNIHPENTVPVEFRMNHWDLSTPTDGSSFVTDKDILKYPGRPVLTTLRHPYAVAISWETRKQQKEYSTRTFDQLLSAWDNMIGNSAMTNMHYFDIDCPKEKRMSHVVGTLKALGVYEHANKERLEEYVDEWKVVGATRSKLKTDYNDTNTPPPELYNWSRFDRAVNWYNMKLKECKYDNFSS